MAATEPTVQAKRLAGGVIDGSVTDTSLTPLGDATAWILGSKIEVTSGANGRFRITGVATGRYILVVRRVGYAPSSVAVDVTAGDTARLWVGLTPATVVLDSMHVIATNKPPRLAEFDSRRQFGVGQFMTEEQIERLNFVRPDNLLRTFTGLTLKPIAGGKMAAVNRRDLPVRDCPLQFFIDGVAIPTPSMDELPSPKELGGIEVYINSASVPLQYKTYVSGGFCGVVLMWTRG